MLDLRFVTEYPDLVRANLAQRGVVVDLERLLHLHQRGLALQQQVQQLRQQRNQNAKGGNLEQQRQRGRELKDAIAQAEAEWAALQPQLEELQQSLPNMSEDDAPLGRQETDSRVLRQCGTPPRFSFAPLDHLQLNQHLDLFDFEAAARVTGSRFYFLKNRAVILEQALLRYALDKLEQHGFQLYTTPDLARQTIASGIGFQPRGAESNIYCIEGEDLCLVGTAEIPLGGLFAQSIIDLSGGPLMLAGLSHCFRREAGAAGQYSKGLYRVHQFSKVEMFSYCRPQDSAALHLQLLAIEEQIFSELEIPYRVLDICRGDLGASAARKFDLEAWMPGRGEQGGWGEVTSASNCRDYQARRLQIRYRCDEGHTALAHTLNGTALASTRTMIALLENGQQQDHSVLLPSVLHRYCGFDRLLPRS